MRIQAFGLSFALLALSCSAAADVPTLDAISAQYESGPEAPLIPREALIRSAERSDMTMSPSGEHVLLINVHDGAQDLTLLRVPDLEPMFDMQSDVLRSVQWNSDGTALVLELGNSIAVAQLPEFRPSYIARLDRAAGDYFLGHDQQSADQVLVVRKQDDDFKLQRISFDGETTDVLRSNNRIVDAIVTADLSPIFVKTISETGQHVAMHDSGVELPIVTCGPMLVDECSIDTYNASEGKLWLRSNRHQDLTGLYSWDVSESSLQLHHIDPKSANDLWDVKYIDNQPVLAQYYGERLDTYTLVDHLTETVQDLKESKPGTSLNAHVSAGDYWLLEFSASNMQRNTYHLASLATGDVQQIQHPTLRQTQQAIALSEKLPFSYTAEDGMILHGYVSLPQGKELSEAPLIALVHGGPLSRTYANYSSLTQLLTNRGYIVVEPNFRGSTGYGRDYLMSSNKDFGDGQVQQDIDASIGYLLDQGLGDRERVGIAGSSFGGYSALSGLAFSSELYKLGIAISAPADLTNALQHQVKAPYFGANNPSAYAGMQMLIADLQNSSEVERLEHQSPLNSLHTIQGPLLIHSTTGDPAVSISHVRDYATRLVQQGTPAVLFVDEGSAHGYENSDSTAAIFAAIESFLSLYFDTRGEPIGPALRAELSQKLSLHHNSEFVEMIE